MRRARRTANEYFSDDVEEAEDELPEYELNNKEECVQYIGFLKGVLMPLIEAYTVAAFTLDKLIGRQLLENDLVKEVLEEIKRNLTDGYAAYGSYSSYFYLVMANDRSFMVKMIND